MRVLALIFSIFAAPAIAHEFWIEPTAYQVNADTNLEANIVNGEEFSGGKLPYLPQRFVNFVLFSGDRSARVGGRPGDLPALQQAPVAEGLNIAAYQANNQTVDYENWEKFQRFVDHKDFGDILSQHEARGLPLSNFTEVYSRHAKTLIGVGDSAGADRRVGLETEIVALTNPYDGAYSGQMSLKLLYKGKLRPNAQVEVFEQSDDNRVRVFMTRTNANGVASIRTKPGHSYLVDAVVLRVPESGDTRVAWETLWAALTFKHP